PAPRRGPLRPTPDLGRAPGTSRSRPTARQRKRAQHGQQHQDSWKGLDNVVSMIMERLAYPPAQAVSTTVAEHFRHHVRLAGIDAVIPDAATIEKIIDAAFWASLRKEEGRPPTISLAYLPRESAATALYVERPLPLDPATLTKLPPAGERPGHPPAT